MKKLLAFVGIILLVGVIAVVEVAKSGEHGVTTVALSEGEISFDWLVEPKMNRITWVGDGEELFSVQEKSGGSWDLINASGDLLLDDFYQVVGIRNSGDAATKILVIQDDQGDENLVTMSGDILVEPQYHSVYETKIPGTWETTTWGISLDRLKRKNVKVFARNFIDSDGNKMFKDDFADHPVTIISKDRFIHKSGDKYGVIDRNLSVIVKHDYPEIWTISVDRVAILRDTPIVDRNRNESDEDHTGG